MEAFIVGFIVGYCSGGVVGLWLWLKIDSMKQDPLTPDEKYARDMVEADRKENK